GGVETLDPKIAERGLAGFAIAIRPILTFHGRVFGVTEKFGSASAETFRGFDDAFASFPAGRGGGCSWHLVFPAMAGSFVQRIVIPLSILATSFAEIVQ